MTSFLGPALFPPQEVASQVRYKKQASMDVNSIYTASLCAAHAAFITVSGVAADRGDGASTGSHAADDICDIGFIRSSAYIYTW
jgi:hypothetical protein